MSINKATYLLIVFVCALRAGDLSALPLYTKDVFCGAKNCGKMEIDQYQGFYSWLTADPTDTDYWFGEVVLDGQFNRTGGGYSGFHYVQTVTVDEAPLKYTDGSNLTIPYIDPPPGGYQGQTNWDHILYYDPGVVPGYYDRPSNWVMQSIAQPDRTLSLSFETWLVCEIEEIFGADPDKAKDDYYQIAPLLGWTWGFDIKYDPDVDALLELIDDFDILLNPFSWIMTPTADWTNSLNQVYGTGVNADYFVVDVGDCEDCVVPAPATMALFGMGLAGLVWSRRRQA